MNIHLKLRIGLISSLVLLTGLGLLSENSLQRSFSEAGRVTNTHSVLAALDSVSAAIHAAQSNQRGFQLTGGQSFETGFYAAVEQSRQSLSRFRSLTAGASALQAGLDHLTPLTEQTLAFEQRFLSEARSPAAYARSAALDLQYTRQIDDALASLRNQVEQQRARSLEASHQAFTLAAFWAGAGILLSLAFVAVAAVWIQRHANRCQEAESKLNRVRIGVEARVQQRTADLSQTTASLEAEISERRNTEAQLRESEKRYRLLFEDSPLPMEVFDPETLAYLAVNTAAAELYGYAPEEFAHMTLRDLRPPEELPAFLNYLDTVKTADSYSGTFVTRHKNGRLITIEARVRNIEFGGRLARLKLVTDITEKKRLETQLQQSQKMEAVGRLAGGIAHDFNNLLMVILGYSDNVLYKLDDADPIRAKVSEIHAAAQRASNLTAQLLAFSRKQILQMQTVQLNSVVSNISQMIRRLLGEDIDISLNLDEDLGQIMADPAQLEQVVVNLAVNARDAMPHGGQLAIDTCNIELTEDSASLQGVTPGHYVQLAVSDTGCGMDEATKSKVFEPFFTTKEVGKGTGLGLSMVLGVVEQSGGAIAVQSEPGLGTTFRIYLPQIASPCVIETQPEEQPLPTLACSGAGATILLVEDENQLRTLAREVLKEAGYTVLEAANGKDALRVAATLSTPPSLLLTDVVMPEMSGWLLAAELQKKWPRLAVVYTSGYTDHALLGRNGLEHDTPFLQKPYMPGQLLEQVAQVLESVLCPQVLIVDDDEDTRFQLRSHLEKTGYRVLEAANGEEALHSIAAHPVKLVITDLFMPEKDGLELISELKKSHPDIKILALSGANSGTFLKLASSLGADVVLPKPFLQEQIAQVTESLLA